MQKLYWFLYIDCSITIFILYFVCTILYIIIITWTLLEVDVLRIYVSTFSIYLFSVLDTIFSQWDLAEKQVKLTLRLFLPYSVFA